MKKFQCVISILVVLVVLAIPTLGVLAKEGMMMTISGPGIKGEVTLEQSDLMMSLEDSGFFGFSSNVTNIKPVENPEEGYHIIASILENEKPIPFVEMTYYPAEEGQAGYVHYTGRIMENVLQSVDEWGQLPLSADRTFRRLMDANNIAIQTTVLSIPAADTVKQPQTKPEVQPANSSPAGTSPAQPLYGTMAIIAAILVVLGAGLIVQKRVASQRSI